MPYEVIVKCSTLAERLELIRDLKAANFACYPRPLEAPKSAPKKRQAPLAPARIDSEGQRLLLAAVGSTRELGARLGVSAQTVSLWRRGITRPDDDQRELVEDLLGIDPRAWSVVPGVVLPPRARR